jgi:biotin synthase-related radical SAM superfamily protein
MIDKVSYRKVPPAHIGQKCPGCNRIFTPPTTPKARKPVYIVNRYTNKGAWRSCEVWHAPCYEEGSNK